jgi:hypothetical protein
MDGTDLRVIHPCTPGGKGEADQKASPWIAIARPIDAQRIETPLLS